MLDRKCSDDDDVPPLSVVVFLRDRCSALAACLCLWMSSFFHRALSAAMVREAVMANFSFGLPLNIVEVVGELYCECLGQLLRSASISKASRPRVNSVYMSSMD